jgi:pimeloyl-ACP methyl ester carboxylesterase
MKSILSLILICGLSIQALAYRAISDEKLQELMQSFNYTPTVHSVRTAQTGCDGQDIEFTTSYPQRESEFSVQAKTFIPVGADGSRSPLILMLPPLGGASRLDFFVAQVFCKNNIAAVVLTTDLTGLGSSVLMPVTDHDETHRRVVAALKGAIIVASTYSEIDSTKIGIFGASLGGILGSVAFSVIPEISAATFIVNGGDIPNILATSDQEPVANIKKARMQEQGFTGSDQYENYLNENLQIDPLHFAKLIKPETIKLYLSNNDTSVLTKDQMAYYNAIGKPAETKFSSLGHMQTVLSVLAVGSGKQQIADWFKSRFALPNPRVSSGMNMNYSRVIR